jgi:hypothetical protein
MWVLARIIHAMGLFLNLHISGLSTACDAPKQFLNGPREIDCSRPESGVKGQNANDKVNAWLNIRTIKAYQMNSLFNDYLVAWPVKTTEMNYSPTMT